MFENRKSDLSAWKMGLLVAATVTVIAVGAMSVMRAPADPRVELAKAKKEKEDKERAKKNRKPKKIGSDKRDPKSTYVAQLTRVVDCEWAKERHITPGNHLREGQEVDLVKGLAEITFHSGAQVILEGPAKFKVVSQTSADLKVGKMTADVPDNVQKFTINTPVARIVDAEFHGGVESQGTPEPSRVRLGEGESIRLGEGESIRID